MTTRDLNLREINDRRTGEYIAHYDATTREIVRVKRGRLLRGTLTEQLDSGYKGSERVDPRD